MRLRFNEALSNRRYSNIIGVITSALLLEILCSIKLISLFCIKFPKLSDTFLSRLGRILALTSLTSIAELKVSLWSERIGSVLLAKLLKSFIVVSFGTKSPVKSIPAIEGNSLE